MTSIMSSYAQSTYPIKLQQWTFVTEEHEKGLEAMYTVEKCDSISAPKINLIIFNEKYAKDTVNLDITIYSADLSDSTSSVVKSLILTEGAMLVPQCGSSSYSNLKITAPKGYDPEKLKLKINFN